MDYLVHWLFGLHSLWIVYFIYTRLRQKQKNAKIFDEMGHSKQVLDKILALLEENGMKDEHRYELTIKDLAHFRSDYEILEKRVRSLESDWEVWLKVKSH